MHKQAEVVKESVVQISVAIDNLVSTIRPTQAIAEAPAQSGSIAARNVKRRRIANRLKQRTRFRGI